VFQFQREQPVAAAHHADETADAADARD